MTEYKVGDRFEHPMTATFVLVAGPLPSGGGNGAAYWARSIFGGKDGSYYYHTVNQYSLDNFYTLVEPKFEVGKTYGFGPVSGRATEYKVEAVYEDVVIVSYLDSGGHRWGTSLKPDMIETMTEAEVEGD